jgi:hypothetical protein
MLTYRFRHSLAWRNRCNIIDEGQSQSSTLALQSQALEKGRSPILPARRRRPFPPRPEAAEPLPRIIHLIIICYSRSNIQIADRR